MRNIFIRSLVLLKPFFKSGHRFLFLFCLILILPLIVVYFNYRLNLFSQIVIDALQKKNYHISVTSILTASIFVASFAIFIAIKRYLEEKLSIIIREKLYLYYNKESLDDNKCEMSCQRMDSNLAYFPASFLNLTTLFIEMVISLPTFLIVLYTIGGKFAVICSICYAVFGNFISKILSKPLMKIVNTKDNVSGKFRRELIEQAKKDIDGRILPDIKPVIHISNASNNYSFFLVCFRNIFGHLKSYFPYIFLLAPYFLGAITLGEVTRGIGAFRYVMQSLAFFTDNRIGITQLNVTVQRICDLKKI